ncbi:MAG: YceI family protein [Bacteroidota bacterium]
MKIKLNFNILVSCAWLNFLALYGPTQKLSTHIQPFEAGTYTCSNGKILLFSDAPLEMIKAGSNKLQGILNTTGQQFAWSVDVKSLRGFNSPLQQEHFNENYLESEKYPKAEYTGKIIEKVDFQTDGVYNVRAKGQFTVHGVTQERIVKTRLDIKGGKIKVHSEFTVLLAEHNITIPRIVHQKIANEVNVTVDADLISGK